MKKKALTLTALACACCLSFGLAACNDSDEITAEKWADLFGGATSYTVTTMLAMPDGSTSDMTVKADGDKRLTTVQFPDGVGELYYAKENGEYFEYLVKSSLGVKQKLPMGSTQPMTTAQFDAMGSYLSVFKDDYARFALADGKYTCASLDKTSSSGAVFTNVSVTFESGALTRVEYEVATTKIVIAEIGKTSITLPQIGADDDTTTSVAGKVFTYFDVIGEGTEPADPDEIEEYRSIMSAMGFIITFGTDNTVEIAQGTLIEQTGTYVADGDTVTITLITMKFDGESQPVGNVAPIVCKYDGTNLKYPLGGSSQGTGGEQTVTSTIYLVLREDTGDDPSRQITETAWRAAFNDSAFDNSTIQFIATEAGQPTMTVYRTCNINGADKYVCIDMGTERMFYSIESGTIYNYIYLGNSYIRSAVDSSQSVYLSYTAMCPDFSEHFSDFTYNSETGAYEYKEAGIIANSPMEPGSTMTYSNITVKFIGGKLSYLACDRIEEGVATSHFQFQCYNYGTTEVTLPTNFADAG